MNQNEEIRVLYVQPGKYPEESRYLIRWKLFKNMFVGV